MNGQLWGKSSKPLVMIVVIVMIVVVVAHVTDPDLRQDDSG